MTNITLVTGDPKSGKSTYLNKVCQEVRNDYTVGGIVASDIRDEQGDRVGFVMNNVGTGETAMLADLTEYSNKVQFGKWFVYQDNIKGFMLPVITKALRNCDVVFIDEIASMQLLCNDFKQFIISDALTISYKRIFITIAKTVYDSHENYIGNYMRSIADDVVLL